MPSPYELDHHLARPNQLSKRRKVELSDGRHRRMISTLSTLIAAPHVFDDLTFEEVLWPFESRKDAESRQI